jgi:tRNA threonylcarbamoyladenosine biosynthesis protein TsaB
MRVVAIEMSAQEGSVALLESGAVVASIGWVEQRENRQQLFDALKELAVEWASVDMFLVGRGPGAFSGMRISFSVVNALAAPGKQRVMAHNSGASLVRECGAKRAVVVGDARREQLWVGAFEGVELVRDFELIGRDALAEWVDEGTVVLSPDRARLAAVLEPFGGPSIGDEVPRAATLGEVVWERQVAGLEGEPFEPLYLHPPVFVEPRFPA